MKRRLTSWLLTLAMLLSLVPAMGVTASAAEPEWTTVNSYEELQTAVNNKKEYIQLGRNIDTKDFHYSGGGLDIADWLTFENQTCTLDLNGKTLSLLTKMGDMPTFMRVYEGSNLTIKDSQGGGQITGEFENTGAGDRYLIHMNQSSLTLEGGTFRATAKPHGTNINVIDYLESNVTVKDGVTISQPEHYAYGGGGSSNLQGHGYALCEQERKFNYGDEVSHVVIEGGIFDGWVRLIGYPDTNGSVQINGGTFKKGVQALYVAKKNNSDPTVTVNGGTFEDNVYLQDWDWKESLYMPYRLNGGTFKGTVDLHAVNNITVYQKPESNPNVALGLNECFGYSAVVTPDGTFAGPDAKTGVLKKTGDYDYDMWLEGTASNPVRIIPNAWGMKSVTLDGTTPINYAKDWKGTVERMDNSTAHTLKFEWYPLASELVNAGYTYRTKCEHYISGSTAVQQTDTIAADKTSHTVTIPAGADPKVYSYDLQLNLQKDDSNIGIFTNDHIVKLVVNEAPPAPPEPPAPVAHSITVTNGRGTANPTSAFAGDTVTVTAKDDTANDMMFTQWYTKTAGVTFADVTKQETTFVMPDCDVQVYPGFQQVSFRKQPVPQISLEKGHGGKTSFAFSWDISKWELVDTENDQTVSSDDTPVKAGKLTDVTIPANTALGSKTYRIVVTTANGEQFKSNDFIVTWFEKMPAPLVEFSIPSDTKFIGEMIVNVGCPSKLETGGASPFETCYTTNGVDPKNADSKDIQRYYGYTDVTLTGTTHFMARTILEGEGGNADTWGELCEASYEMIDKLDAPTVTPTNCSYSGSLPIIVTIQDVYNAEIDYTIKQHNGYSSGGDEPGPMLETGLSDTFCGTTTFSAKAIVYNKDGSGGAWESDEVTYTYTREYWANISNATISGNVGAAITDTDVTITLDGEKFKDVAVGDDVSAWFNLPAGLTAKVKEQTSYSRELVITISGTPTADSVNTITVTIPKEKLLANNAADLTVLSNPKAYYSISTEAVHTHDYTGQPYLYLDPGNHYQECKAGDGYNILAHAFTPWTDNNDGTHSRTCTVCKMADGSTYTETANHNWQWVVDTPATSTTAGKQHEECPDCHAKRNEGTVIPATGGSSSSGGGGGGGGSAATPPASDKAAKELKNAKEGSTVTIDMKGETKLPASVTKEIAGKDVTVELDMGGGMVWSFSGLDVPKGGVSLDLGVKTGTKTIPAKVIHALTGETTTVQLQLSHSGPFGMSLKLSVDLGKKHDGLYANLYFYNPKSSALEFRSASRISGGKASWAFDHASDYAIVIDKESHEQMTFTDVPDSAYYAEAVNWAVAKKITGGIGNKLFGPNDPCTRAQIVTFLWRAAGSPEPKAMSTFADVSADAYYAKAVAWAVENGITGGTGDGKFSPDATCTRAQAVTFLWRANGSPAVSGNAAFRDVAANAYYAAAVTWAEQNGITGGIGGGLFGSDHNCTRAQIVTFLYSSMK